MILKSIRARRLVSGRTRKMANGTTKIPQQKSASFEDIYLLLEVSKAGKNKGG